MDVSDPATATTADAVPENLVEVGRYRTLAEGSEHGLVVLAMGRPYWLIPEGDAFQLRVEPVGAEAVRRQLACFDRESRYWPPAPIEPTTSSPIDTLTPLLWSLSVLVMFWAQQFFPGWTNAGALDARRVFDHGEVWRALTALFLHADAAHVLANGLSGLLVFSAMTTTIGRARGWLLVLVAAIVGNLAVAAVNYPGPYRSLGASTALFAAVGLLAGRAIRVALRTQHPHRWRSMFAPVMAGGTVLALYGAGGMRVDVPAHFTGFVAGLVFGIIAGLPRPRLAPPA